MEPKAQTKPILTIGQQTQSGLSLTPETVIGRDTKRCPQDIRDEDGMTHDETPHSHRTHDRRMAGLVARGEGRAHDRIHSQLHRLDWGRLSWMAHQSGLLRVKVDR
jgi:hypothetical protein